MNIFIFQSFKNLNFYIDFVLNDKRAYRKGGPPRGPRPGPGPFHIVNQLSVGWIKICIVTKTKQQKTGHARNHDIGDNFPKITNKNRQQTKTMGFFFSYFDVYPWHVTRLPKLFCINKYKILSIIIID